MLALTARYTAFAGIRRSLPQELKDPVVNRRPSPMYAFGACGNESHLRRRHGVIDLQVQVDDIGVHAELEGSRGQRDTPAYDAFHVYRIVRNADPSTARTQRKRPSTVLLR